MTTPDFKQGAVAFLDALGFKGIWRRFRDPAVVLEKMRALEQATREKLNNFGDGEESDVAGLETRAFVVSDSIFLAAWPPEGSAPRDTASLAAVILMAANAALAGLEGEAPLVFRGAVGCGSFDVDPERSFIVGPAVDEVVSAEQLGGAGLVWLAPSALQLIEKTGWGQPGLHPYPMPLKGGARLETLAINPMRLVAPAERPRLIRVMLRTMDAPDIAIRLKRQHTVEFFKRIAPGDVQQALKQARDEDDGGDNG